ncbi:MAG: hypothetical protein COB53_06830 [Elusimicrobia bacterium]|nr:MAG: hypothetical protein COB53_06830 [Elusimicrobiota bacterium]
MSQDIETEGKTVTIAVEQGLKDLKLSRDEVEVTVLEEGNAGFLGMGSKPARVRIRRKRWEDDKTGDRPKSEAAKEAAKPKPAPQKREPQPAPESRPTARDRMMQDASPADPEKACAEAKNVIDELLKLAGISFESITCTWDKSQERVHAEIDSEDGELLIGKGGKNLEAIQFLVTIITGRRLGQPTAIQVETEGYWAKLEEKILAEADRAVDQIKADGGEYRFEPMDPALRRLIHRRLADNADVMTASEGEGSSRKVVVKAR